ncbi:cation transporter, partial [Streptomyces sp. MCAF7]
QSTVAAVLGRRPGVLEVKVNPVAQSATVVFDPRRTSLAELRRWVTDCGYHCAGQVAPSHVCDPMAEPDPPGEEATGEPSEHEGHTAGAVLVESGEQTRTTARAVPPAAAPPDLVAVQALSGAARLNEGAITTPNVCPLMAKYPLGV